MAFWNAGLSSMLTLFLIGCTGPTPVLTLTINEGKASAALTNFAFAASQTYEVRPGERQCDRILATLAVLYTLFMIYAGGLKFILLSAILFAPGTVLYYVARREQGKPVFERSSDWIVFALIVAAAIYGVYGLSTGAISI